MTLPRRRTRVALLAAALTLLAAPVATAGSAHAGTWSHQDARGDVVRLVLEGEEETAEVDAADATSDITRLTVRHQPRKVVVTLKLRDLQRGDSAVFGRLKTPRSTYDLIVMRTSDARVFSLTGSGDDGSERPCRGKKQSFDTQRDRITLTVPRICLGDPRWVRAGAGYLRGDLAGTGEDTAVTLDEALRTGSEESAEGDEVLRVGRKVRVG